MRAKRVRQLKKLVLTALYDEEDLATKENRRMIEKDGQYKSMFRARKKNYKRTTQNPKLEISKRQKRITDTKAPIKIKLKNIYGKRKQKLSIRGLRSRRNSGI